jgi:cation transport regulator ChaC
MDLAQMRERCPRSTLIGPALLAGWRFRITRHGYATVVPEADGIVHGALWDLTLPDEVRLDAYEGVAEGLYSKRHLPVTMADGREVSAMVYVMSDAEPGNPIPGYLEDVMAAAKGHSFPQEYLKELASWRPE